MQTSYKPGTPLPTNLSRRQILRTTGAGFGALALAGMLAGETRAADEAGKKAGPLAPKAPHFAAKPNASSSCFWKVPSRNLIRGNTSRRCKLQMEKLGLAAERWSRRSSSLLSMGQTGTWVSELFPHCARHVDKLCFSAVCIPIHLAHPQAVIQCTPGAANATLTRPSMGGWLLYGLGSVNQDCPATSPLIRRLTLAERLTMAARSCRLITKARASPTKATCPICKPVRTSDCSVGSWITFNSQYKNLLAQPGHPMNWMESSSRMNWPSLCKVNSGIAGSEQGTASGLGCLWCSRRACRQLCAAMFDGS